MEVKRDRWDTIYMHIYGAYGANVCIDFWLTIRVYFWVGKG